MMDTTREHKLEAIIVDLADGHMKSWWDIKAHTGVSEERAKELEKEINEVFASYFWRNR